MNGNPETVWTLEQCLLNSWPAIRSARCDGWIFRYADGFTRRANSASALAPTGDFSRTLEKARAFYAGLGQPAIIRLTPLANPDTDAVLNYLGFMSIDPTIVMSAPMSCYSRGDKAVTIRKSYSESWGAAYAFARGLTQSEAEAHATILRSIALPTAYATWHRDGEPLAFGLGVLDKGCLGLFDIATAPAARRRGGARKIVSSLMRWGQSLGARTSWLSVIAENAPAIALYQEIGFAECYRYHYRMQ